MRNKEELIGKLQKDEEGYFRMVYGKKIYQIEEKTQDDIDLNKNINLWRMRNKKLQ